jgi:flagellar basal-body rod protein FlgB
MIEALWGGNLEVLDKAMSLRMARHGLLAANIANAETPNYRAVDIDFKATMARLIEKMERGKAPAMEIQTSDPRHFTLEEVRSGKNREGIVFAAGDDLSVTNDNNSVNLEEQLARMQSNAMLYNALSQILRGKLSGMKGLIESAGKY